MSEKRYSTMSMYELQQELAYLHEKARKAEQMGMVNEFAVLERKAIMVKAYMIDPKDFVKGEIYGIQGDPGTYFKVDYLNGVFAWGYRLGGNGKEEGVPISILEILKEEKVEE